MEDIHGSVLQIIIPIVLVTVRVTFLYNRRGLCTKFTSAGRNDYKKNYATTGSTAQAPLKPRPSVTAVHPRAATVIISNTDEERKRPQIDKNSFKSLKDNTTHSQSAPSRYDFLTPIPSEQEVNVRRTH